MYEKLIRSIKKGKFNPNHRVMPIKQYNADGEVIKPLKHQVGAFLLGVFMNRVAYFMEQGTGKTLPMIATLGYRFLHNQINKALIFCPLSVASEIERQFEEFADYPYNLKVLAGVPKKQRDKILDNWSENKNELHVIVLNYENSWDRDTNNHKWDTRLSNWSPDVIVCDESQRLKNGNSVQTKAICNIAKEAGTNYRIIMTGTPMADAPLDIFGQYKFLDMSIFGKAFGHFKERYTIPNPYSKFQIKGYQNLKELGLKTHRLSYRATKEDCLDLPPVVERIIQVELEPQARKLYNEMRDQSIIELDKMSTVTAPLIIVKNGKLAQLAGGYLKYYHDSDVLQEKPLIKKVSNAKLEACIDKTLSLLYNGKKVVIFAKYIAEVDDIIRNLKSHKVICGRLTGDVDQKSRKRTINNFQKPNSGIKVIVAQIATGGVGITLTAADTEIFYSRDYRNELYEQAKARVDRLGQKHKVTIYHIVARDTIDIIIAKALIKKQDVSKVMMGEYYNLSLKKGRVNMVRYHQEPFEIIHTKIRSLTVDFSEVHCPTIDSPKVILDDDSDLEEVLKDMEAELKKSPQDRINLYATSNPPKKSSKRNRTQSHEKQTKSSPSKPRRTKNVELTGDTIQLKQIAEQLDAEPRRVRQWLRKIGMETETGRWEWSKEDPQVQKIIDEFPG